MTVRPCPILSRTSLFAATILVVDDDPEVRRAVRRVLGRAGHRALEAATLAQAKIALDNTDVDLVVLDLGLPDGNGLGFLSELVEQENAPGVVIFTASESRSDVLTALQAGAAGYVHKPVDPVTLEAQVDAALLRLKSERSASRERATLLASLRDTKMMLDEMPFAFAERLCTAWDLRHVETGTHVRRIALYTEVVARALGFSNERAALLGNVAMLHDIGKIAIPDAILTKPGKLTPEEFQIMKLHAAEGGRMLGGINHPFVELAAMVALRHHERWDGSGYPGHLVGEACPFEARIVAVVDVYDALGQPRCYKSGWSEDEVVAYMRKESGKLFDPAIVDALLRSLPELRLIALTFPESLRAATISAIAMR
jgi:response regulator RpfG family c-di-GMP phosphodiesterase